MPIEEIKGYTEFQRDTDAIIRDLPQAMHDADLEVAREWLQAAQALATTSQQQLAASSVEVDDQGLQGVDLRSDSPIFYGAEFGGQARPSTMHFPPHMGRRGYWLYPAKRQNEDRFMEIWDKGIQAAMDRWDHKE